MKTEDSTGNHDPYKNVVNMANKIPYDEWRKRITAINIQKAIEAGDYHTISGIFRKNVPEYSGNITTIKSKQPHKWDDIDFRNRLVQTIAQLENPDNKLSQKLHGTLSKILELYDKSTDGNFPRIQTVLTRSCKNLYDSVNKLEIHKANDVDITTAKLNFMDSVIAGINATQKKLAEFNLESSVKEVESGINPLVQNLYDLSKHINRYAVKLGITTSAQHL